MRRTNSQHDCIFYIPIENISTFICVINTNQMSMACLVYIFASSSAESTGLREGNASFGVSAGLAGSELSVVLTPPGSLRGSCESRRVHWSALYVFFHVVSGIRRTHRDRVSINVFYWLVGTRSFSWSTEQKALLPYGHSTEKTPVPPSQ